MAEPIVVCTDCGAKNRVPLEKQHLQARCGKCGRELDNEVMTGVVLDLDATGLKNILSRTNLPLLVDFYSPTCGPCQVAAPLVYNVAEKFRGRAVVAKVDTSRHQAVASEMDIRGVPTLIVFKGGMEVDRLVGVCPQEEMESRLGRYL